MDMEIMIVGGPHSIAIGDLCRFVVAESPGAEQDERVRILAAEKKDDGVHFTGATESEGLSDGIPVTGVYDYSHRSGKIKYTD